MGYLHNLYILILLTVCLTFTPCLGDASITNSTEAPTNTPFIVPTNETELIPTAAPSISSAPSSILAGVVNGTNGTEAPTTAPTITPTNGTESIPNVAPSISSVPTSTMQPSCPSGSPTSSHSSPAPSLHYTSSPSTHPNDHGGNKDGQHISEEELREREGIGGALMAGIAIVMAIVVYKKWKDNYYQLPDDSTHSETRNRWEDSAHTANSSQSGHVGGSRNPISFGAGGSALL